MLEGDPSSKRKSRQEYSVGAKVLEELKHLHPFVPLLMRHRKLTHFTTHSGDMGGYGPSWAREGRGICRLRPTYQQTNVETGRVVTENPNLQCVPRLFPENPQPGDLVLNPRAGFVASKGHVLLSADYRQLELRIMAHFSGDERLISAFKGGAEHGADPFVQLAAQWQNKPVAQVAPEDRRWAKAITYGMLYGKGPVAIGKDVGKSTEEAIKLMREFERAYPQLADWRKKARARGTGGRCCCARGACLLLASNLGRSLRGAHFSLCSRVRAARRRLRSAGSARAGPRGSRTSRRSRGGGGTCRTSTNGGQRCVRSGGGAGRARERERARRMIRWSASAGLALLG